MISIASISDIPVIQRIAEASWWPAYGKIVSPEQIRWMLDTLYSTETLEQLISSGEQHFLLIGKDFHQGFAAYGGKSAGVAKLHKLYVLPETKGKGLGKMLLDEVKARARQEGFKYLDLNVNRDNPSVLFYQKQGFQILHEEDISIGNYWMNDYVMRMEL